MKRLVIFASGSGTNAENIIRHFQHSEKARVVAVFCNNPQAGVIERAARYEVPVVLFNREMFRSGEGFDLPLEKFHPDLIVLAGFLWLIPERLVEKYRGRMINIHPALLPAYGGKGMYGQHVHRAVLEAGDTEHGVTVHYVNEHFDDGEIILQEKFSIDNTDTPETVESKIHEIEFRIYPAAIEKIIG